MILLNQVDTREEKRTCYDSLVAGWKENWRLERAKKKKEGCGGEDLDVLLSLYKEERIETEREPMDNEKELNRKATQASREVEEEEEEEEREGGEVLHGKLTIRTATWPITMTPVTVVAHPTNIFSPLPALERQISSFVSLYEPYGMGSTLSETFISKYTNFCSMACLDISLPNLHKEPFDAFIVFTLMQQHKLHIYHITHIKALHLYLKYHFLTSGRDES